MSRLNKVLVCALTLSQALVWGQQSGREQSSSLDWSRVPVAAAPEPTDSQEKLIRMNRSAAFNDHTGHAARVDSDDALAGRTGAGSAVNMVCTEPLPVAESSAVVLGQIAGFQPFLSLDHTAVYTELNVKVEQIMKDATGELDRSDRLTLLQHGGSLRLADGRVARSAPLGGLPALDVNERYVLFLRYAPEKRAFSLRKAWLIQDNHAVPLAPSDIADARGDRPVYSQMPEASFLSAVREAASQPVDHP